MFLANLAIEDDTAPVDQKCRWIRGLMWGIPPQTVKIGECIVWIDHQAYVARQWVLLRQEFHRVPVEIGMRTGIHQKHLCSRRRKLRRVFDKIVYLPHTVRALISRVSPQNDESDGPLIGKRGQARRLAARGGKRKGRPFWPGTGAAAGTWPTTKRALNSITATA